MIQTSVNGRKFINKSKLNVGRWKRQTKQSLRRQSTRLLVFMFRNASQNPNSIYCCIIKEKENIIQAQRVDWRSAICESD